MISRLKALVPAQTLLLCSIAILAVVASLPAQPIRLDPQNPHYFLFHGKPAVLVTSGEHYGAVLNLDFNYQKYLATLAADHLNYTRLFTGEYVEKPGSFGIKLNDLAPAPGRLIAPWARSQTPGYHNGGNKFDLDRWDPAYFRRLKDFVRQAGRHGIVVEVSLFSSQYNNWDMSPLNWTNTVNPVAHVARDDVYTLHNGNLLAYQVKMVRKIVGELDGFDNVIYEIINEPYANTPDTAGPINPYLLNWRKIWQNRVDLASQQVLAWQRKIAAVIADTESSLPKRHLIAQNFANFRYPLLDIDSHVSILNFHYAWPDAVTLNYGFDRVIGFDETGFSGHADATYRRQAWNFLLAGGALFDNLDYSFTVGHEDGTAHNRAPGGGSPALRAQLGVLKHFLESFDFIRMRPNHEVVRSAPGVFTQALGWSGHQYAIYVNGGTQCTLTLALPPGRYQAEWVSTKTGAVLKRQILSSRHAPVKLQSPGYSEDIALRIVRPQ
jgi:hypothetical protein